MMQNNFFTIFLTSIGLIGLFIGIYKTHIFSKRYQVYVVEWKFLLVLLYFFVLGYLAFIYNETRSAFLLGKLLISAVFLGGGLFVFLTMLLIDKTIVKLQEINELKIANKELQYLADCDDLTGIFKRRYFENALNSALILANKGKHFAVLFIDINDFKIINDTSGHLAGDAILVALAKEFQHTFRSTDVIARVGGDEFAVLLAYDEKYPLAELAQLLINRIDNICLDLNGKKLKVNVSVGVVAISKDSTDTAVIMRTADEACYEAKHKKVSGHSAFVIK